MYSFGFKILKFAFVVFLYKPIPWYKIWKGYKPGILGNKWKTLYFGPLKIVTGPAC